MAGNSLREEVSGSSSSASERREQTLQSSGGSRIIFGPGSGSASLSASALESGSMMRPRRLDASRMALSSGSSQGTPGRGPRLLSSGVPARLSSSSEVSGRKQLEIAEEAEAAVASVAISTAEEAGEEVAITPVPRGKMTPLAPEKKHLIKRLWKLSWPYTHVRVVLSLIPVVLSLLTFLLAYLKWPEAGALGPKVWGWALSFLILSMSVIITALVISGLLFLGSSYWARTSFFLYLLNIRGPGVFLIVAVCGLAIDIWWVTGLWGDFDFY